MNWNLDDLPVFVAVVDHGGVSAAARALGRPKSTVSHALARLEAGLGLRLVDRGSRALRVTSEGETFYRQAGLILDQARAAEATMAGLSATPAGRLSVALPPAFCQEIVAPRLAAFRAAFPRVELDLVITAQGAELLRDQVDLAVVVGPQPDSELVSRSLLSGPLLWVAAPAYLEAGPVGDTPEALRAHVQIVEQRYALRRMPVHVHGAAAEIDLARGIAKVNDPLVVRRAVLHGAGVSVLPAHYCRDQIAAGSLVEVCPHIRFDRAASTLTALYPGRRLLAPKTRAFLAFLEDACR